MHHCTIYVSPKKPGIYCCICSIRSRHVFFRLKFFWERVVRVPAQTSCLYDDILEEHVAYSETIKQFNIKKKRGIALFSLLCKTTINIDGNST